MPFKRFLAVILLLILPLQSTLAVIDSCCNRATDQKVLDVKVAVDQAHEQADSSTPSDEANCCAICGFCHHTTVSFDATASSPDGKVLPFRPVPHPDTPIESFIPEVPSRPDRA